MCIRDRGYTYLVDGGFEFDGREISTIDKGQIRRAADDMANKGVEAISISGIFSSVDPTQEQIAAQIIQEETPHIKISMSHEIGRVGVLERENATILNACLSTTSDSVVGAFKKAVEELNLGSALFLTQNDGTLMDADFATKYPVYSLSLIHISEPTRPY